MWDELLEKVDELVATLFVDDTGQPFKLTRYQKKFLEDALEKKYLKMQFCAATRSGKSEIISIAIVLLALIYPNEDIKVISYTWQQSQIIFNKAKQHIFDNPDSAKLIDTTNEFSRQEINFKNGSKVKCMSAGGSGKGEGVLGFGATILVIDESGSIEDEIYYQKIMRMITAGRVDRMVIESGTPHRKNHFFETFNNPNYHKYVVTWREAVDEGQMSEKEVMEIKERISEIEFKMWYEAQFPEEAEDSLFKYNDVKDAQERTFKATKGKPIRIIARLNEASL